MRVNSEGEFAKELFFSPNVRNRIVAILLPGTRGFNRTDPRGAGGLGGDHYRYTWYTVPILRENNNQDQIYLVPTAEYIGFYVHRESWLLWSSVLVRTINSVVRYIKVCYHTPSHAPANFMVYNNEPHPLG